MKLLPILSIALLIVGVVMLDNSGELLFISIPALVIGMVGCFISIVKYRKR